MKTIQFGKRYVNIPTQFTELSTHQLVRTIELQSAELTVTQFNVLQILNLLKVNSRPWLKWFFLKNEYLIPCLDKLTFGLFTWTKTSFSEEDFHELCQLSIPFQKQDKFPLDNPFPELRIGFRNTLVGPEKLFANLTFRQFRKAEEYFIRYFANHEFEDLNHFLAWLYLPKSKISATYQTQNTTEIRSRQFSKLNINKGLTILYFYLATREKITKLYPYLYPKTGIISLKRTPNQIKTDFEKSVRMLSGNITKDEITDLQNVHDALAHLNDKAKEVHDLQESIKKQKSWPKPKSPPILRI